MTSRLNSPQSTSLQCFLNHTTRLLVPVDGCPLGADPVFKNSISAKPLLGAAMLLWSGMRGDVPTVATITVSSNMNHERDVALLYRDTWAKQNVYIFFFDPQV